MTKSPLSIDSLIVTFLDGSFYWGDGTAGPSENVWKGDPATGLTSKIWSQPTASQTQYITTAGTWLFWTQAGAYDAPDPIFMSNDGQPGMAFPVCSPAAITQTPITADANNVYSLSWPPAAGDPLCPVGAACFIASPRTCGQTTLMYASHQDLSGLILAPNGNLYSLQTTGPCQLVGVSTTPPYVPTVVPIDSASCPTVSAKSVGGTQWSTFATDDANLYMSTPDIWKIPYDGSGMTILASVPGGATDQLPIQVSDGYVYFADKDPTIFPTRTIQRVPVTGGTPEIVACDPTTDLTFPFIDGSNVWFLGRTSSTVSYLAKVAKP